MYKHAIVIAAAFVSAQAVLVNIGSQLKTTDNPVLCAAADEALSVEPEVCCEYSMDGKTGTDSETVEQG